MELTGAAAIGIRPDPTFAHHAGLFDRLRASTGDAHRTLENALGLLDPPLSRTRFAAILKRFLGFHRVWESALDEIEELTPLRLDRSRIAMLEADLAALGQGSAEIAAARNCRAAGQLGDSAEIALGSLYVMEGSTLGGQIISRTLAGVDWAPEGGLTYFNPYGRETGSMWRRFKTEAEALVSPEQHEGVIRGARACFALLTDWLPARVTP